MIVDCLPCGVEGYTVQDGSSNCLPCTFQWGGYSLPFLTIGAALLCGFVFSMFFLPEETDEELPSGGFLSLMKIPGVVVTALVIVGCAIALSFLDPTFSKHFQSVSDLPQIRHLYSTCITDIFIQQSASSFVLQQKVAVIYGIISLELLLLLQNIFR